MCTQKIKLIVFLFLSCALFRSFSQITVSPTVGCVPLNGVTFSGPAGATGINWNFGDAVSSNLASPTHNYTSAGNYIVTYNATVGASAVTYTTLVIVHGKPTANFTYTVPAIRCKPLNVPFTSTSSGPAAITSYTWNFGDGGQGSGNTPIYVYNLQGAFFVTLLVTDANGCVSSASPPQGPINVSTKPTVIIKSNPLALISCTAPFTPAFSASNCVSGSPIPGPLVSYSWNFGNSSTSTQQTPGNITYNTPGVYNVSLTVTDNNNCSNSAITPVIVSQPSINATIPGTVCLNTPFVFSYQTNQSTSSWNFGIGSPTVLNTSTVSATTFSSYVYSTPGTYTISISAGSSPCTAVQTKTIYVEQVVANFSFTPPSFTCSPTFVATYTNQSSANATSFSWTASNYNGLSTSTSTLVNPTFTLVQGSLNPYTIYQTFGSIVTLVAQSANGCISTFTTHVYDSIRRPTAWFNKNKKEGCAPLTVTFRDSSFTNTAIYPITSYTWNNGANPAVTVSGTAPPIPNFVYTYTAAGTYTPFLTVQTASGCIDVSFIDTIHVANPPVISFSVSPNNVCWNQPVIITNTSPTTTPAIQHWHVDSDAGFFSGCVNDPNPQWNFTHIGVHTFTMSGYLYSCKGTGTTAQTVNVKGPIVQSRYQTNCNPGTRRSVNFYSQLQDVQNATINFGDATAPIAIAGVPGSITTHSINHVYTSSGNYVASVTATNNITGCAPYTYTMLVTVRDIQANFTYSNVGCAAISQTFDASPSIDVFSGCRRGYTWYFDNLPPRDTGYASGPPIITFTFANTGIHTVMLMVKDENSCLDTTKHTLRISNASPTFTFSSNPICLSSGTVQMVNTTAQTPDIVNNFTWDFGDATGLTTTTITSPTHTYFNSASPSQNYTVTVVATNAFGCVDSTKHILTVVNPNAALTPSQFLFCIPTGIITYSAPAAYTSYTFNFGDGSPSLTTTNNIAPHTYTADGTFTTTLIVDIGGCKNMGTVVVSGQKYAIPDFSISPTSICKDAQVHFTNTSTVVPTYSYNLNWNLGVTAPIIPAESIVWTYTTSGSVVVSLTVTTSPNQCASVISKTVNIFGVKAKPVLDKQVVCFGDPIHFSIRHDSSTVNSWDWDFGDGYTASFSVNASPSPTIAHVYNFYPLPNGNTFIQFAAWSSMHVCFDTIRLPIQVEKIDGNFDRNNETTLIDYNHCLGVIDQFSNQTPSSSGYNFNWNFGDGVGSSSTQNPSYTYPLPGIYTVTLNITDPVNSCKGIAIKNMTINALPAALINSKDSICQNAPFTLNSTTTAGQPAFTYTWNPSVGLTTPNNYSSTATATNSITYTLILQDANGCKNSTTKSVYIQLPPASFQWDSSVVVGQVAQLHNYSGSNFTYTWSPPTDLSCINCPYPVSSSLVNITYTVTIADKLHCFIVSNTHTVDILPKSSVDVPTAFTPNGDGTNDVIYVAGWGIKKLNYFRVFNRWGQLLFESNDIKIGWDGRFDGIPQNMETYVYQVSVETYVDKDALLKTGTFKLIR